MMKKKKVLFLIHTLGVGGAEKVLVNLVNNLDKNKYDVTLMTVIDTGIFRQNINPHVKYKTMFKIPFVDEKNSEKKSGSLHANYGFVKSLLKKIYQFIWRHTNCKFIYRKFIRENYDYEIAFLEGVSTKIISASNNLHSKKYAWIHVDIINEQKSDKFYKSLKDENKCYSKFNKIIGVSNVVKNQAMKKLNVDTDKYITIYNPIDADEIITKSKEEIEFNSNMFTFCTVGRLAPQKGYDRLINVSKKLVDEGYKFKVKIIGEGPDKKILEQMIIDNNLIDVVKLLGFKSNPYPYMLKCNVFICSSRAEGFSTVVSEAVVLQKPCLTTECSGMKELFGENNKYGYVVSNDDDGIYKGMKDFLENNELVNYYSSQSIINSQRFNLGETINEIQWKLLNEV